mmetsp:Transcript_45650/g.111174  ORF Transcript_45650/g.111174 Transcript_45650/m.111174 type:complete len:445 (+) Transcript_45650:136-1470(+)
MSSLAATQADGYYVPTEYFESGAYKEQSKNQFNRASKTSSSSSSSKSDKKGSSGGGGQGHGHNQWLRNGVVRFELPHRGRCLGPNCTQLAIGQGTRYNARKVKTGESYFTTPIVEFHLKCRSCGHPWIIRTNPAGRCFDFVDGIKKHDDENNSSIKESAMARTHNNKDGQSPDDNDTDDPLQRLEIAVHRKDRAVREWDELQQLKELNDKVGYDDAVQNANVRRAFRKDRKQKRSQLADASKLGWRPGMQVLAPSAISIDDVLESEETVFGSGRETERKRMSKVRQSSIFDTTRGSKKPRRTRPGDSRTESRSERADHVSSSSSISTTTTTAQQLCHSWTNGTGGAGETQKSEDPRSIRKRRKIKIVGKNDINTTPRIDKEAKVEEGRSLAICRTTEESKSFDEEPRKSPQKRDNTTTTTSSIGASSSSINDLLAGYGTSDEGE